MKKPTVGQTLYMVNIGNAARWTTVRIVPVVVDKVGRKYFSVGENDIRYSSTQFHLDTWCQKTEYSADYQLYESEQAYHDEKEQAAKWWEIESAFRYGRPQVELSLQDIRRIHAIIYPPESVKSDGEAA